MCAAILICGTVLTSCTYEDNPAPSPADEVEEQLRKMTLREKVGQLFFIRPEALDTTIHWKAYADLMPYELQEVNDCMKGVNEKYPVGGIILYAWNIKDEVQLAQFLPQLKALNGQPLMCIDEEGGRVARIANNPKHFPGHGDTKADTHYGYAQTMKTWGEMLDCEIVTFRAGIQWGCELIMTAHISAPNVTGEDIPSTMSSVILQDKLRRELGYQNIIVTDAMDMGAITQQYTNAEATVGCILAGADIVLCPKDFVEAFEAVIDAIEKGTLTEERLNQSVRRILTIKQKRS